MDKSKLTLALRELMKKDEFGTFIQHLFTESAVFSGTFSTDPAEMARRAGRQEIGLELLHDLNEVNQDFTTKVLTRGYDETT